MSQVLLTPGQQFDLFFDIKLTHSVRRKIEVRLQLHKLFGHKILKRTLLAGRIHSLISRTANFLCTVPINILGRSKKKVIPSLGNYTILVDRRILHRENFPPAHIVDNNTYFERETVPETLRHLGFSAFAVGGPNEPDIMAYHKRINPQKIDVEPTLTNIYKLSNLDNDRGKFQRYIRRYNFKRLLTVCESKRISSSVINELSSTSDPIGLIEFRDLYSLRLRSKSLKDQMIAYTKLTSTGKITVPYLTKSLILFEPIRLKVTRWV